MLREHRVSAILGIAAATAVGYYLGGMLGFALRFPPATTSVLWPPNAILTASLLLVRPQAWWICLLAVFPAHLLMEIGAGWPMSLVLGLFFTNCSEAILAAAGIRLLSDAPGKIDTLRRAVVFIVCAVLIAPILSSFADAAVVYATSGEPYWTVWRTRVFANALTQLAIVPLVLNAAALTRKRLQRQLRESLEPLMLVIGVVVVALMLSVVFGDAVEAGSSLWPLSSLTVLLVLPLLFWGAVRLGSGGLAGAVLVTALLASMAATGGRRPFTHLKPADSLIALQLYLCAITIPLLCLSALLKENRTAARAMTRRLRFEELLSRLSGSFVSVPSEQMSRALAMCLDHIGRFFDVDRSAIFQLSPDGRQLVILEQWVGQGIPRLPASYSCRRFPWVLHRLLNGDVVECASMQDLPVDAVEDRRAFEELGLQAALCVPLVASGRVHGVLSLHLTRHARPWARRAKAQARLVADVLANALARKRSEDDQKRAELDAQRARHELAHVTRASAVGELTSSLAHQLNQPLTGILSNAQAAERYLASRPPNLDEIRDILLDIIDDDRRAGDVIRRLREMATRTDSSMTVLDLHALLRDLAVLMNSDTIIRNVAVSFELAPGPARVSGHRVELQQMFVHVLVNAMEAVADAPVHERTVTVRSARTDDLGITVAISDCGPGIPPGAEERIFEAFFKTKSTSLGMGLTIARSIVEAHGGRIAAANNPSRGATISVRLPLVPEKVM